MAASTRPHPFQLGRGSRERDGGGWRGKGGGKWRGDGGRMEEHGGAEREREERERERERAQCESVGSECLQSKKQLRRAGKGVSLSEARWNRAIFSQCDVCEVDLRLLDGNNSDEKKRIDMVR